MTDFETKLVLDEGAVIPGKSLREHNEAKGHAEAWGLVLSGLVSKTHLTAADILAIHQREIEKILETVG